MYIAIYDLAYAKDFLCYHNTCELLYKKQLLFFQGTVVKENSK